MIGIYAVARGYAEGRTRTTPQDARYRHLGNGGGYNMLLSSTSRDISFYSVLKSAVLATTRSSKMAGESCRKRVAVLQRRRESIAVAYLEDTVTRIEDRGASGQSKPCQRLVDITLVDGACDFPCWCRMKLGDLGVITGAI